jgi:hypothetical protein
VGQRYLFDRFSDQLAANAERAVAKARARMKKPVRRIVFWKDAAETLIPQDVALFASSSSSFEDADVVVPLARPRTSIPGHIDLAKEKGWDDALDLYRQLLSRELHRTLSAVAPNESATRLLGDPDGFERIAVSAGDRPISRALAAAGVDASNVRAIAERCFAGAAARAWLVKLAPKKKAASFANPRWRRYFMARTVRKKQETLYFEVLGNKVILYVDCKYVSEHPQGRAMQLIADREREGWRKLEVE